MDIQKVINRLKQSNKALRAAAAESDSSIAIEAMAMVIADNNVLIEQLKQLS